MTQIEIIGPYSEEFGSSTREFVRVLNYMPLPDNETELSVEFWDEQSQTYIAITAILPDPSTLPRLD